MINSKNKWHWEQWTVNLEEDENRAVKVWNLREGLNLIIATSDNFEVDPRIRSYIEAVPAMLELLRELVHRYPGCGCGAFCGPCLHKRAHSLLDRIK